MNEVEIRAGIRALHPEIPWAHHFELAPGIETITPENEKFHGKAVSLKRLGQIALDLVPYHTVRRTADGLRVLDVASGEGGHTIEFALHGAQVVGVEGRELYVSRADFVAGVKGVRDRVRFIRNDVRKLQPSELGTFDVTLAFGILHHLDTESFFPFLSALYALTSDTLFLYTHISSRLAVERHRLKGPVRANGKYEGYLFQEHDEAATTEQRIAQVRAALDNTYSFWANQESLCNALEDVGFRSVAMLQRPHVFNNFKNASYRPILICRK